MIIERVYTRKEVIDIIDQILQHADCVMDAISNEDPDYDGESLLDIVEEEMEKQ